MNEKQIKTILILGAGGFIGKSLVKTLSNDYHIKAFDKFPMPLFAKMDNVESIVGDFKDETLLPKMLDGVDLVIHLVSTTIPSDDTTSIPQEIEDNIIPTVNLLNAMVKFGVNNIIFASSGGTIYGDTDEAINTVEAAPNPSCSYGVQKVCIENYIKFFGYRYDMNYCIMRISNPYGVGQDNRKMQGLIPIAMRKLMNKEPITIFGDGTNMRDYIYIDDLVNCFKKVINYQGEDKMFNIGYGKYYSINEVLSLLENCLNTKFIDKVVMPQRMCDVHKSYLDFAIAQKELDWQPLVSVDEGIKKLYKIVFDSLEK